MNKPSTLSGLRASGYEVLPVKEELRRNLISKLRNREPLFPGIIGYEDTVIPHLVNAILAKHDIILLGLRGQAKTRIARLLTELLDEWVPIVKDSEINDDPFSPISYHAVQLVREMGDETPIEWVHRSERYGEKLATPDVTIADIIGDIDPLKAAHQRLHYSHEGAIHFGIIPRTNRGIFTINELPDLQPRIQVGLFNLLEERDIQIRGFNIRIPLDVMMVFTANPEDYTNRGNIITPLKDRISSQIITHYPLTMETAISITEQEAWTARYGEEGIVIPKYFKEIIEQIAFEARKSEFIDQKSGVSARLTTSAMEALVSNAERRTIVNGDNIILPRVTDLAFVTSGVTGKVELVFEGEQEGMDKVARALIGKAVKEIFKQYFPDPLARPKSRNGSERYAKQPQHAAPAMQAPQKEGEYDALLSWFSQGNMISLTDTMKFDDYYKELSRVPRLRELTVRNLKIQEANRFELASAMEFVLDGLHQHSKLAKEEEFGRPEVTYRDMIGSIFTRPRSGQEEDDENIV
ncbi:MAG TPA: magnesium chelatase [Candidatus Kapabacteria bacterium]|jgi:magnesium chelatase subunit I|nr:magnesium chelatase [Candidatus Kapabacteria bacterium]